MKSSALGHKNGSFLTLERNDFGSTRHSGSGGQWLREVEHSLRVMFMCCVKIGLFLGDWSAGTWKSQQWQSPTLVTHPAPSPLSPPFPCPRGEASRISLSTQLFANFQAEITGKSSLEAACNVKAQGPLFYGHKPDSKREHPKKSVRRVISLSDANKHSSLPS